MIKFNLILSSIFRLQSDSGYMYKLYFMNKYNLQLIILYIITLTSVISFIYFYFAIQILLYYISSYFKVTRFEKLSTPSTVDATG